ncbi:MAG TPA: hypothetical protein VLS93_14505 [Anaeromyxobacteraceae bacterium]|nr:hypothetical protein [Anaeromyxobacteraceae bacterium]
MKKLALAAALLLSGAARAQVPAEDLLPPPPPPPPADEAPPGPKPTYSRPIQAEMQQAQPAPRAAPAPAPARAAAPHGMRKPGTIGEGPVAPAGSPAAPLHPDESISHWRFSLASGVSGRWGGMRLSSTEANSRIMIFFGGQADGLWSRGIKGIGKSFRLRMRMFTGGEDILFAPSDGDVEAAFMLGRRELRFVIGRIEAARFPGLGLDVLLQAATLPCFEGSISFASDRMRFYYYVSPVSGAWARYHDLAHIDGVPGWPSEVEEPSAATALRARYTAMVPPSVLLSVSADFMKMWSHSDAFFAIEGSAGVAVLDGSVILNTLVVLQRYTRRGLAPSSKETDEEVKLLAVATLAF